MQRCLLALMAVAVSLSAHASLITTSAAGDLMFEYLGGEAGPSHQEFGIGTPSEDSSAADRNVVFVVDYTRPPVPVPVVNKGYYPAGSGLEFYNLSDYAGDLFAFSSRLTSGPTAPDLAAFTDRDNSLPLGGSVVEVVGGNRWILHLDDAWSYRFDDDDNEMIIAVWVAPAAAPAASVPEPGSLVLLGAGVIALVGRRRGLFQVRVPT
jgi:hypothetical protein